VISWLSLSRSASVCARDQVKTDKRPEIIHNMSSRRVGHDSYLEPHLQLNIPKFSFDIHYSTNIYSCCGSGSCFVQYNSHNHCQRKTIHVVCPQPLWRCSRYSGLWVTASGAKRTYIIIRRRDKFVQNVSDENKVF
jgi:hypothetical protein